MVFLLGVVVALLLLAVLATGIAALPLLLFIPVIAILAYVIWMVIKRTFTARPQ